MDGGEQKSGRWARLIDAASFAMTIHAEQLRKGSDTPDISHLLGVASLVLEFGGDEDQAIAGLLHDAIEDQGVEQEPVIEARFGPRVAAIVRGCTDADSFPKPPWQARKVAYIAHLEMSHRPGFDRSHWPASFAASVDRSALAVCPATRRSKSLAPDSAKAVCQSCAALKRPNGVAVSPAVSGTA